jgi:hypothetical protein
VGTRKEKIVDIPLIRFLHSSECTYGNMFTYTLFLEGASRTCR